MKTKRKHSHATHTVFDNMSSEVKKFIAKLQAKVTKLELENSDLRIDKHRLKLRVKSLEATVAKHDNSHPDADKLSDLAAETLKKLSKQ